MTTDDIKKEIEQEISKHKETGFNNHFMNRDKLLEQLIKKDKELRDKLDEQLIKKDEKVTGTRIWEILVDFQDKGKIKLFDALDTKIEIL